MFDNSFVKRVKHCSGVRAEVGSYWHTIAEFKIQSNHDDIADVVLYGAARYALRDMFASSVGPHQYVVWSSKSKHIDELAAQGAANIADFKKRHGMDENASQPATVQMEHMKRKRKEEALGQARAALCANTTKLKQQRTVNLTS